MADHNVKVRILRGKLPLEMGLFRGTYKSASVKMNAAEARYIAAQLLAAATEIEKEAGNG